MVDEAIRHSLIRIKQKVDKALATMILDLKELREIKNEAETIVILAVASTIKEK